VLAVQPKPVGVWLRGLALVPKSKTHVRGIMHSLFEFAMFAVLNWGVTHIGFHDFTQSTGLPTLTYDDAPA
jgi:hypothetical protein